MCKISYDAIAAFLEDKNIAWKQIMASIQLPTCLGEQAKMYIDKNHIVCFVYDESIKTYHCIDKNSSSSCMIESFAQKKIPSPQPPILTMQWNISLLDKKICGIVGPRKMSTYAQRVLDYVSVSLQHYSLVTISWWAVWVDQYIHNRSLAHDIPTIVVLGGGIAHAYTTGARDFLTRVVDKWGLIISESKLWQAPQKYSFPLRNRIIAALSDMIFLPEASEKSWSLWTVHYAHTIGTPLYTVPCDIFSLHGRGTNLALQKGIMHAIIEPDDMLQKYFTKKEQLLSSFSSPIVQPTIVSPIVWSIESYLAHDMMLQLGL
jgi:DNA processing protein